MAKKRLFNLTRKEQEALDHFITAAEKEHFPNLYTNQSKKEPFVLKPNELRKKQS